MVSHFGQNFQAECLDRAERISLNINTRCLSENIVAHENRYTCFQSIAKWHINNHNHKDAEIYLNKMIALDPYDSTAYSELGLHQANRNEYIGATASFKQAVKLGPPGTSMNTYYYAKCLEITGNIHDSIEYLHKSASLDTTAVSPWLDLHELYNRNNDKINATSCVKHILSTPTLRNQLATNEIRNLESNII
tara:strand:- start:298 stop:876 length:579 start_codon:yes stop_codon:yes gene_type:complete